MSEEQRAVLEERADELLRDFEDLQEEWVDGYISFDECVESQQLIREEIAELYKLLYR